jgi:hypothetical protein
MTISIKKLLRAKKILDAAPVPQRGRLVLVTVKGKIRIFDIDKRKVI